MAYALAPSLKQFRAEVNETWPQRDKASDGWIGDTAHQDRPSDHNPGARDLVHAFDTDEDLDGNRGDAGADAIPLVNNLVQVEKARVTAGRPPRLKYLIYEAQIMSGALGPAAWQWRPYAGVNAHRHHVHLSILSTPEAEQDTSPWLSHKQGGGPITKDWFDMATKEELADVVREQGPWLGEVYGDPDRALFIFSGGTRVWMASMEAILTQRDYFQNLHTDGGNPFTPKPAEARGFYLVNRAELEAALGHPYTF